MKKIYFAFILVLSCLFSAHAEESGFFVGGNVNYGSITAKNEIVTWGSLLDGLGGNESASSTGYGVGILGGYKHFFQPNMGFRAYLDYNTLRDSSYINSSYDKIGLNADFLYNFEDIWLTGVFAGLYYDSVDWGYNERKGYFGLSTGARKSFGPHGVEIGLKVPLSGDQVVYEDSYSQTVNQTSYGYNQKIKVKETYHLFVRYIFSF